MSDTNELRKRAESKVRLTLRNQSRPDTADPSQLWYELQVHRVELELQNDELRAARATIAEIRDRYSELYDRANEALAGQLASEAQSTALLDTASDAIVCSDSSGTIEVFNRAAERLFGYTREEILGTPIRHLLAPPDREQLDARLGSREMTGTPDVTPQPHWEAQGVRKDGSLIPLEIGIGRWSSRGERKFTVILHDLSNRKRAEAELRNSELLFRSVFEHSPVGMAILSLEGYVQQVNAALARFLGRDRGDLMGEPFADLIHADDREIARQAFEQAHSNHVDGCRLELRYSTRGGPVALGQSILAWIYGDAGKPRHGIALVADVTAQRKAEVEDARRAVQLSHARKLEALGTLASGVAHDFGNLLMGIRGCAHIGLDALAPESPARIYVEEIKRAAERGAVIPKRLLQFSRKRSAEPSVFELNHVVAGARRMLERLLGEDIELCVRTAAEDSRILSDAGQMEQILLNLAANARDAMPGGGVLVIETRNQTVLPNDERLIPAGEYVALSVTDSGQGMSDEVRERIFEPFFTTKESGRGTGLGLSAVHGIVEQAGGHIRVISQPNQGASFEILLPKTNRRVPTTHLVPEPEADMPQGHGTVLVVEDDPAVRLGIRYYLERGGYRVLEAGTGAKAIECGTKFPGCIDLLLIDVVLPQTGGARIAREFTLLKPACAVLFMSAHPAEHLEREGRLPLGAPVLQKPFGPEILLARVHEELGGEKVVHPAVLQAREARCRAPAGAILVVDDEPVSRLAISEHFRNEGWVVFESGVGRQALELCRKHRDQITVLLIDYSLPDMSGDDLASQIKQTCPEASLVYMSGYPGLKLEPPGTLLQKPIDLELISATVAEIARHAKP